ncbi:MAG TPA: bifunctional precorrin-2 dehydrogenase/sirohydrochlorin ferrochelatase [Planctomycetota bacterium]|nr:bifunctional precorrin-2 dehydrogenase/sirohydrochlorin ferrochelatase [Planctomycetota bacterium]
MYYPLMLKVKDEACLIVGGGRVALQKARALRRAGADVTAVSPEFSPAFRRLRIRRLERRFREGDVRGRVLVIAATDSPATNRAVHDACRRRCIPVNVVDVPDLCSVIVPSVLRRGPVVISISTGGQSPPLAKALRRQLDALLPRSIGTTAARLGAERRKILRALPPSAARTRLLKGLVRDVTLSRAGGR